jgi:hypothetical protein
MGYGCRLQRIGESNSVNSATGRIANANGSNRGVIG